MIERVTKASKESIYPSTRLECLNLIIKYTHSINTIKLKREKYNSPNLIIKQYENMIAKLRKKYTTLPDTAEPYTNTFNNALRDEQKFRIRRIEEKIGDIEENIEKKQNGLKVLRFTTNHIHDVRNKDGLQWLYTSLCQLEFWTRRRPIQPTTLQFWDELLRPELTTNDYLLHYYIFSDKLNHILSCIHTYIQSFEKYKNCHPSIKGHLSDRGFDFHQLIFSQAELLIMLSASIEFCGEIISRRYELEELVLTSIQADTDAIHQLQKQIKDIRVN